MPKHPAAELLIRSKYIMLNDISQIIALLHQGDRRAADALMDDLKVRSLFFYEEVQQKVLMFVESICFQYDYDPWHKVTPEIQKSADRLIEELGFPPPSKE